MLDVGYTPKRKKIRKAQKYAETEGPQYEYFREKYTGSFEKKIRSLLSLAATRAKERGIPFSITAADLTPVTHCPLLGILLDFAKKGRGAAANSPSIDRIDPTKGYVPGNVWVISSKANRMKSDATLSELEMLVAKLREKMGL